MKMDDIKPNTVVRHIRTGDLYRITGSRMTKINGEWVKTIDYVRADGTPGEFGRERFPFSQKFALVK